MWGGGGWSAWMLNRGLLDRGGRKNWDDPVPGGGDSRVQTTPGWGSHTGASNRMISSGFH